MKRHEVENVVSAGASPAVSTNIGMELWSAGVLGIEADFRTYLPMFITIATKNKHQDQWGMEQ